MTQQRLFLLTQESSVVDNSTMAPSSVLQRTGWIITWSLMAFFVLLVAATELNDDVSSSLVARLEKRELVEGSHFWPELSKRRKRDTSATTSEEIAICKKQGETFLTDLKNGQDIDKEYVFQNETNHSILLTWAGDGIILVGTTTEIPGYAHHSSNLYISTDYGKSFQKINNLIEGRMIKKGNGLQRHRFNKKKVYIVTYCRPHSCFFLTSDGGHHFSKIVLDFDLDSALTFHQKEDYILTLSQKEKTLHVTQDGGLNWKKIGSRIDSYYWSTSDKDPSYTIYAAFETPFANTNYRGGVYTLKKTSGSYETWTFLLEKVVSFGIQGNFMYASTLTKDGSERKMQISSDAGRTWNEAELETITHDRFFSILDMSEGLVFMHVDDPGDTGHGTLYTSGQDGIIYSESLKRHLYPSYVDFTDFYKVESIRGVYLASKIQQDQSISTVITFDRGGIWQEIQPPVDVPCKEPSKGCFLQVHNVYSRRRGIYVDIPLSVPSAVGLILVHGHVANALQITPPDVFVTSDGGYTWRKALSGPHHYRIADSGGLLVAIPAVKNPKIIKFSTDEGRCWHEYKFTNDNITYTGLLTEPGSQSMSVSIWGYRDEDRSWKVHVIDFRQVIKEQCDQNQYKPWLAHSARWKNTEDTKGCLLGTKTVFYRLAIDSWCYNGYDHKNKEISTTCKCTRADYECDYGYEIDSVTNRCQKSFKKRKEIDICIRGHEEKIISEGYRKIPGDNCSNADPASFHANTKRINLGKICHSRIVVFNMPISQKTANQIIGVILVLVVILVIIMSTFLIHKLCLLRRHKVVYRYSLLSQTEEDIDSQLESALNVQKPVYDECSDDEDMLE